MTPTEQDEELREKIHSALFADDFPILNNIEKDAVDRIVAIIQAQKADRKRVALEEREKARKFYAKRKPQFTKTWVADVLGISRPTLDKWIANPEQFTIGAVKKLAELKAQQEEV